MAFVKKTWKDRISQYPNRRTINDGYVTKRVTVGRDEGTVTEEGTPFDATEMNDLENRIYAAIEQGGGGGGGAGTYDYTELFNKPRINSHELNGNKSLGDLGIASNANELPIESGSATNTKDYIDSKFIYSTTEKVVGKWIDDKPIYEKTISLGYLPDNTSASTPHNISNLKFIIGFQGFGYITNSVYFPLPFVSSSPIYVAVSTTDVTITATSNRSTTQGYITLRYVKN